MKINIPAQLTVFLVIVLVMIFHLRISAQNTPAEGSPQNTTELSCPNRLGQITIIEALRTAKIQQEQISEVVRRCGVDFVMDEKIRLEFAQNLARPDLLKEISGNYRAEAPQKNPVEAQSNLPNGAQLDELAESYPLPAYTGLPVTKTRLMKMFGTRAASVSEIIKVIGESGVDFPMTFTNDEELYKAAYRADNSRYSAGDWMSIVAAVAENYRGDGKQNSQLVKAVRLYQTRQGANRAEKIAAKNLALALFKELEAQANADPNLFYYIAETYNELSSLETSETIAQGLWVFRKQNAYLVSLFDNAVAYHEKNIARQPDSRDSWEKLAVISGQAEDYPRAVRAYKKLVEFAPKNQDYWQMIGDYSIKIKDYQTALEAKQQARLLAREADPQLDADIEKLKIKVVEQP